MSVELNRWTSGNGLWVTGKSRSVVISADLGVIFRVKSHVQLYVQVYRDSLMMFSS